MSTTGERDLDGRTALVSGAAAGIGAAVATRLATAGARVVLCDWHEEPLRAVGERLTADGAAVQTFALDVRDRAAVDAMFDELQDAGTSLDILVNNAGGTFSTPFADMSPNGEHAVIAENFTSVTHLTRRSIPMMEARGGGSVVNVTSIEAHRAAPGVAVYAAMKAAVMSLSKSLALELAPLRIRVNCVAPDMIDTEGSLALGAAMEAVSEDAWFPQPLPDKGSTVDAAEAVAFLAGPRSTFITGTTIHVDGGNWASVDGSFISAASTWCELTAVRAARFDRPQSAEAMSSKRLASGLL